MAAHTAGTVDIGVRRAVCDSAAGDTRMPVVVCVALPGVAVGVGLRCGCIIAYGALLPVAVCVILPDRIVGRFAIPLAAPLVGAFAPVLSRVELPSTIVCVFFVDGHRPCKHIACAYFYKVDRIDSLFYPAISRHMVFRNDDRIFCAIVGKGASSSVYRNIECRTVSVERAAPYNGKHAGEVTAAAA